MILFYSDYCKHCRMLLDTIKTYDKQNTVKLVCIEGLKNPLPQIHSVPAMVIENKKLIFGKEVFDYLLLPRSGKLMGGNGGMPGDPPPMQIQNRPMLSGPPLTGGFNQGQTQLPGQTPGPKSEPGEPMAFSIGGGGLSEAFSSISDTPDDVNGMHDDRAYMWTQLDATQQEMPTIQYDQNADARTKKELPDLAAFAAQRELDLGRSEVNTTTLPPAISGR